jgi:hypothetical protein
MRREPAKVLVGEGVLPAPPLPLKPTVGRLYLNSTGSVLPWQGHVEQEINKLRVLANISLLPN